MTNNGNPRGVKVVTYREGVFIFLKGTDWMSLSSDESLTVLDANGDTLAQFAADHVVGVMFYDNKELT